MATAYIDPDSPLGDYLNDDLRSKTVRAPDSEKGMDLRSSIEGGFRTLPSTAASGRTLDEGAMGWGTQGAPALSSTRPSPSATATEHSTSASSQPSSPLLSASSSKSPTSPAPQPATAPASASTTTTSASPNTSTSLSPSRSTTSPLSPIRPPSPRHLSENTFAERFKYLICSSALLEKDYVPGLGEDSSPPSIPSGPSSTLGINSSNPSPTSSTFPKNLPESILTRVWEVLGPRVVGLRQAGTERWDVVAAGVVGLFAAGWIVGIWRVLGVVVMAGCAVGFWVYLSLEGGEIASTSLPAAGPDTIATPPLSSISTQPSSRTDALESLNDLLASSRKLDSSIEKSLSHLNPHPTDHQQLHSLRVALHRLTTTMTDNLAGATSTLLGLVDKTELGVLGEMYDIPVVGSFLYTRKGQLGDMDDDDASGYRPGLGSVPSPRRNRWSLNPANGAPGPNDGLAGLGGEPGVAGLYGPVAQPMSISRSLPGHFRPTHTARSHHLSLSLTPGRTPSGPPGNALTMPNSASSVNGDDRFTTLPNRRARISKRSSWEVDTWSSVRDSLSPAQGGREPGSGGEKESENKAKFGDVRPRRLSRPSHERRITEADEGEGEDAGGEGESMFHMDTDHPDSPARTKVNGRPLSMSSIPHTTTALSPSPSVPTSPSPFPRRTTRRSPLANDGHVERFAGNAGNLPTSPYRLSTPNPKRRSLQNMPYNPSSPTLSPNPSATGSHAGEGDVDGATGLTRTRSLPFTDIQSLRSRYATGNGRGIRSRTQSQSTIGSTTSPSPPPYGTSAPEFSLSLHSPTPRIRRVISVSPLTLPSLKAACHAIHMRRRRLACCLLGLRFDEGDLGYWEDVVSVMSELRGQVDGERERLDEAIEDVRAAKVAQRDRAGLAEADHEASTAPWRHRAMDSLDSMASVGAGVDFAPRSSDEVLLRDQIAAMRVTLDKAWKDLDRANRALMAGSMSIDGSPGVGMKSARGLENDWGAVRRDLGEMVRGWERGREAVKRMVGREEELERERERQMAQGRYGDTAGDERDGVMRDGQADSEVPDFMRAWSEDDLGANGRDGIRGPGSPSTSFETDQNPQSLDEQLDPLTSLDGGVDADIWKPHEEVLPKPGRDIIFEAEVSASAGQGRVKSDLSREERIGLMKAARERGMTFGEMLAKQRKGLGGEEAEEGRKEAEEKKKEEMERFRAGGMVVDELRGMMDLIKARKV